MNSSTRSSRRRLSFTTTSRPAQGTVNLARQAFRTARSVANRASKTHARLPGMRRRPVFRPQTPRALAPGSGGGAHSHAPPSWPHALFAQQLVRPRRG
eukprot:10665964-Lingulodinium_polyedra.AAC.1